MDLLDPINIRIKGLGDSLRFDKILDLKGLCYRFRSDKILDLKAGRTIETAARYPLRSDKK